MSATIERARLAASALLVVGGISVLNGFVAGCLQAEKVYNLQHYTNTHWITTVTLFAGLSAFTLRSFTAPTHSLALMLSTNLFAITVAAAAVVADAFNVLIVVADFRALYANESISKLQIFAMISYSVIDFVLCAISVLLILAILSACIGGIIDTRIALRSSWLLAYGTALIAASVVKLFGWIYELYWLRQFGNTIRYSFMHYTIDEPIWIAVGILTGILCTIGSQGGAVLRTVTFCLSSLSIHPSVLAVWTDYRWYSNAVISHAHELNHSSDPLLLFNLSVGIAHTTLLIAISLTLIVSLSEPIELKFSSDLRLFLLSCGVGGIAITVIMVLLDMISANVAAFYRLFYGTEQKTPFLLLVTAVLMLLSARTPTNHFVIPALVACLLLCIQSTSFLLIAYNYLAWNGYFPDELCELFFQGAAKCTHLIERAPATMHFCEALLYLFVLITSSIILFVVLRIIQCYKTSIVQSSSSAQLRQLHQYERIVKWIGIVMLAAGLIVFLSTVVEFFISRQRHPLIIILSSLYHTSIGVTLIIIPIYQVSVSGSLTKNPLSCASLVMVSAIRFVEVLTQLDYANFGEAANFSWRLQMTVEVASMGAHFVTIIICIRIAEMVNGSVFVESLSAFRGFNNPLSQVEAQPQPHQATESYAQQIDNDHD